MLQTCAGQKVWVHEEGQGEARLFLHSALGRHDGLIPLARAMGPAQSKMFDLPGHGRSADWMRDADYQTDVMNVAVALLDRPAHIIGHSFGATVALRLAVDHPDLVQRLTLIEPVLFAAVAGTDAGRAHDALMAPFVTAWDAGDTEAATAVFLGLWSGLDDWGKLPERVRRGLAAQIHLIPETAPAIQDDIHGVTDRLSQVSCPVDLIEGSASQPVIPAIMGVLEREIPQTTRTVIDGAGHMAPITHPAEVAAAMMRSS